MADGSRGCNESAIGGGTKALIGLPTLGALPKSTFSRTTRFLTKPRIIAA
jgi:hypothetical protein